jgi:8-oxo-dGTP pyrophosphatase MutT (NUDIX family)
MAATFLVQGDEAMASILTSAAQLATRPGDLAAQVAAVCYRRKAGEIEFLLVNTSAGKWTFPKGGIGWGTSPRQAALQEAWEEGGVSGAIEKTCFTWYLHDRGADSVLISAFLLNVRRTVTPIETFRNPRWFRADKAKRRLGELRSARYRKEFERVIDLALARLEQRSSRQASA